MKECRLVWEELEPLTEAMRKALLEYKNNLTPRTLNILHTAINTAQQATRRCLEEYWLNLCNNIQLAADIGNVRRMYEGIKEAAGPTATKTAPLKSKSGEVITDQGKQLEHWIGHYLELNVTQNVVTEAALDAIPDLPEMVEFDEPRTLEELSKAIDSLASGKSPGADGIPAEILKTGKAVLLEPLHQLLCLSWELGYVPQDMRDANIVTLYKEKRDRSDCNSCRGISLLSIVGKAFTRVVLTRLQSLAEQIYLESQCGFCCRKIRGGYDFLNASVPRKVQQAADAFVPGQEA